MKIRNKKTGEIREFDCTLINSSKLSAQNRQRLYWCGKRNQDGTYSKVEIEQPQDRGILLRDILESGAVWSEKGYTLKAQYYKSSTANMFAGHFPAPMAVEPVRIGTVESGEKSYKSDSQAIRVYSPNGKSVTLSAGGGGQGGKTGLYAVPVTDPIVTSVRYRGRDKGTKWEARSDNKSGALDTNAARSGCIAERVFIDSGNGKIKKVKSYPIYEVLDGFITVKEWKYPIKLPDGFYIIRKLTVTECKRLQTVPDSYDFPVSDTQAYKMLGNGWTVDVIAHILSHCPEITEEPLDVLSMYDGMACGHIALNNLGAQIARYRATEIDKYAIKTACHNFPDIIQLGDAYQVRENGFN